MYIPDIFDLERSLPAMGEPGIDASVKKADMADASINQAPAKSRGCHDPVRVTSVDNDLGVRRDAQIFQCELQLDRRKDIGFGGMIVEGVILLAIDPGFQIRRVNLNRSGEVLEDGHLRIERVIDRREVGFEEDDILGRFFVGKLVDEATRSDESERIVGRCHY